jgi:hypothetical protein
MSGFAKGAVAGAMDMTTHLVGTIGSSVEAGRMTDEEGLAVMTLMAEFVMSCCANSLAGRPAHGEAPLPDADAVKATFRAHFAPVIEEAAIEGRQAIEDHLQRVADEGKDQPRH